MINSGLGPFSRGEIPLFSMHDGPLETQGCHLLNFRLASNKILTINSGLGLFALFWGEENEITLFFYTQASEKLRLLFTLFSFGMYFVLLICTILVPVTLSIQMLDTRLLLPETSETIEVISISKIIGQIKSLWGMGKFHFYLHIVL